MNLKSLKFNITIVALALFVAGITYSCHSGNNNSQKGTSQSAMEENHSEHGEEANEHDEEMHENTSGQEVWIPSKEPFSGGLKLVKGNASQLKARFVASENGNVLSLETDGNEAVMLMNGIYDNLGTEFQYNATGYQGQIAVHFHYKDSANYDVMVLDNHAMEIQRFENGNMTVVDSKDASIPNGWATVKLSAAGEHLKCFLNGKQYDHGHAEVRPAGKVGIMLKGKGKVELKKLTVIPLEE